MSTSTDLRERPSEQERPTLNQLTTTGLTLVSAGFTLYPTRMENGRLVVLGVAALEADGHKAQLVVQKDTVLSNIPDTILDAKQHPDVHFLNVDGFEMSVTDGQHGTGARAINFGMIPDFESFSSGLHLAPDWRTRKGIRSCVPFNGGEVIAVPDENSAKQTCEWTDFASEPQRHGPQPLTSATVYARGVQTSQSLVLTSKDDRISIEFRDGIVFAAFVNFPAAADPTNYSIDFDHINSMMQLCDKSGEVRFTLGEMRVPDWIPNRIPDRREWPEWLTKLLGPNEYFAGRPHCGARQMRAPAA